MDTEATRKQRNIDLNARLGKRLAMLRRKQRVRQAEVAKQMGFGRPLVSKIEHGQRELSAVEIPDYARAINVEPDVIYREISRIVLEYDSTQNV